MTGNNMPLSHGKAQLVPRLHSVKFVFDNPAPAGTEIPDEIVLDTPFSSQSSAAPGRFVFKLPSASLVTQAGDSLSRDLPSADGYTRSGDTETSWTSNRNNPRNADPKPREQQDPSSSQSLRAQESGQASQLSFLRGPTCDLLAPEDWQENAVAYLCTAWAIILSSQIESLDVSFEVRSSDPAHTRYSLAPRLFQLTVDREESITSLLARVKESLLNPTSTKLVGDSSPLNDTLGQASGFHTLLDFSSPLNSPVALSAHSNYDLSLSCVVDGHDLALAAWFTEESRSRSAVRLLLSDIEHVVWQISNHSHDRRQAVVGDIQILSPASQRQLINLNRPLPIKENVYLHDLVAEQVRLQPQAPAVCAWDGSLTYSQLQREAERLAAYLSRIGVGPEVLVPIIFEKSVFSVVAIMGVVWAGGAVVALDPSLPSARIQMIIEEVKATVVVSSAIHQAKIPDHIGQQNRVVVDQRFMAQLLAPSHSYSLHPSSTPDDSLYVVFTSGSTGKPKGVVIPHATFCSSAKGFAPALHLDSTGTRVLQYSSFSFDISMLEILATLMFGGCLCIPSDEDRMNNLAHCIASLDVNWAMLTPSVATLMKPEEVPSLKVLCLAGEALPQAVADKWADHVKTINAYGPAECSAITIVSNPRVKGVRSISLGRPPNCAAWIVGENGKLAPFNGVGEIVLEGPPVAREYLGDKLKTEAAFLSDPNFLKGVVRTPSRCYRTGDLGRMNADGTIDYLGRKDTQVKINGQRVELGEIEYHLRKFLESAPPTTLTSTAESTWDVAIELLRPRGGEYNVLTAFIAARSSSKLPNLKTSKVLLEETDSTWRETRSKAKDMQAALAGNLPGYLVPKAVVPCRRLPLSPSGKIDRKALRNLGNSMTAHQLMKNPSQRRSISSSSEVTTVSSRSEGLLSFGQQTPLSEPLETELGLSPVEKSLRKAWSQVLAVPEDSIRPADDFFKLGGDSIGAIKVVAACRQLDLRINVATIFKNSVLSRMALVCESTVAVGTVAAPAERMPTWSPFELLGNHDVSSLREEAAFQCGIEPEEIEDLYPCTHMQEGLMAVNLTRPGSYTGRWIHPLPRDVDLARFKEVWEKIHTSSPILRTRFATTAAAGSLQAVTSERVEWLTHHDLEAYLEADDANPMFPGDALNRFALVLAPGGEKTFVWTIHHMLYDGWSLSLLCNRLNDMFHGREVEPAADYRRFVAYAQNAVPIDYPTYWQETLRDVPQSTFPAPPKPGHLSIARAVVRDHLEIDVNPSSGLTMSTLVRAAWSLMIAHYAKSDDVVFGLTVSGRNAPLDNIEKIDGPTIATVPLRVKISRNSSILDFLHQIQDSATTMIPYEQVGIQQIKMLNDDAKRACEFQNLLVVQGAGGLDENGTGPLGKPIYREEFTTFPVTCEVWLQPGRIEFASHVDEDVTSRVFVAQAVEVVKIILTQLAWATFPSSASQKLNELSFNSFSSIHKPTPPVMPEPPIPARIHEAVSQQAAIRPDHEAVVSTSGSISYADLDRMSSILAAKLDEIGIGRGDIVPLCFEKSIWHIVSMVGVMKAGAAFSPLDPTQPIARLRKVVTELNTKAFLTSSFHAKATDLGDLRHIVVDRASLESLSVHMTAPTPLVEVRPDDPAYVLFTSGSTGTPKGTVVSHLAFATSTFAHGKFLEMSQDARVLQFSAYSFDASLFDMLGSLMHGATVCVPSDRERVEELEEFMRRTKATYGLLTPSVARLIDPAEVPLFRTLILGGEAPDQPVVSKWLAAGARVFNGYGPTEASVMCVCHRYTPESDPRTIGKATGCTAWITKPDDPNILVADGEIGELVVEGPILAQGYLNNASRTSEVFITNPPWLRTVSASKPARLYRTGDLVRMLPDGDLLYIGRRDLQVKVNGQRIELGDIESHLGLLKGVKNGIVVFPTSGGYSKRLVAVLELTGDAKERHSSFAENAVRIKQELSTKIPNGMVPSHWVEIATLSKVGFPLSASGKINRKQITSWVEELSEEESAVTNKSLQIPSSGLEIRSEEQPAYDLAKKVASLLASTALLSQTIERDAFDDILLHTSGLDSLHMMSLMHFVHSKYRVRVSMQLLMNEKTSIRSLAAHIDPTSLSSSRAALEIPHGKIDIMAEVQKYDTKMIELLGDKSTKNAGNSYPTRTDNLTIFLTGGTGYLGTQILRQLLESPEIRQVVVLARGGSTELAKARVIEAAQTALWWTEFHEDKLDVWKGDLEKANLGLDHEQWSLLSDGRTFDVIIHNGAIVHWNKPYSALEAVNIGSTVQLLGLAVRNPSLRFAYVSGGRQWKSEDEIDEQVARELSDSLGYSQTKFVAEILTKNAALRCATGKRNISVFRPGLIIGTSTEGVANTDDYVWRTVAANIEAGVYNCSDDNSWLDLSDATTTATAAIKTALHPQDMAKPVRHHDEGMSWITFWSLVQGMGYDIKPTPASRWLPKIKQDLSSLKEKHPLWPLAHLLDDTAMDWNMEEMGARKPSLQLKVAVMRNIEFLVKTGFLPTPVSARPATERSIQAFSRSRFR
ncbi:amino acid adenylation domain-containing protein [Thozetella sp. PMI_491]|nr:amino acid adenylation domain-containing protein [Thozetella sp. PMI_491]